MTVRMTQCPVLHTDRLTLRPMTQADWPRFRDEMAAERTAYMGGPFDATAAWGIFCHGIAGWSLFGAGALMVTEGETTVGEVGINQGPRWPEAEIGWTVFAGFEGRGIATEAAGALRDWTFANTDHASLVSYIDPDNTASHAVAERLGAVRDPDAAPQDPGDIVYRHRRAA